MNDCIFCSITMGDKEKLIWESDTVAAFHDIKKQAPTHVLIVPKQHIERLDDLDDADLAGQLLMAAREIAEQLGVKGNYRLSTNNGAGAGQIIDHLHFHLISGMKPTDDPTLKD